jgi:mono/diheme cytochrome c family protein
MKKKNICFYLTLQLIIIASFVSINGCGDNPEIGIGPIKEVKLEAQVNEDMANKGKAIFEAKCVSCHKFNEKLVGPPLAGITKKRKPEWIMNMILNPVEMTQKNPAAQELYRQFLVQMTYQDVTQDDARNLLEYFRSLDK